VVITELVEPASDRSSESLNLGGHRSLHAVLLELFEELASLLGIAGSVEVPEALFDPIGLDPL
jgi:hypothetical protein